MWSGMPKKKPCPLSEVGRNGLFELVTGADASQLVYEAELNGQQATGGPQGLEKATGHMHFLLDPGWQVITPAS
jgi:hypothetical protein